MSKKLPKDTKLTKYFRYKGKHIFGITNLDNKETNEFGYMLKILHCWEDGEIMKHGWQEPNDDKTNFPTEQAPNPRHIVKIFKKYPSKSSIYKHIKRFIEEYYKNKLDTCSAKTKE